MTEAGKNGILEDARNIEEYDLIRQAVRHFLNAVEKLPVTLGAIKLVNAPEYHRLLELTRENPHDASVQHQDDVPRPQGQAPGDPPAKP